MNGLSLFSGIGGIDLALAPWVHTVAYCEIDPFCQRVLHERFDLENANLWTDVRQLNGDQVGPVDIIFGGFPCQPFSTAARGRNNAIDLWPEMLRLVRETKPRFVFAENVTREAIEIAAHCLAGDGYVVRCAELPSSVVGTPHDRKRSWLLADADGDFEFRGPVNAEVAGVSEAFDHRRWEEHRPDLLGVDDGVPARMDRLRALGNAVVPAQARRAFEILSGIGSM